MPTANHSAADRLTAALLACGMLLSTLAALAAPAVPPAARGPFWQLALIGALLFAIGGVLIGSATAAERLGGALQPAARYLGVTPAQGVLLLTALPLALLARLAAGNEARAHHATVAGLAWLAAAALALLGSWRPDAVRRSLGRREAGALLLLFVAAWGVRVWRLGAIPAMLSGDEASAGFAALRFLNGEMDNLFTIGWFSFPSLYFAVNSSGLALFGRTAEGVRLLASVAGAATVVAIYLLGRALFDRATGALAAGLLLAGHFHIHFSRIGLQNGWDGLFATLALLGAWVGWRDDRRSGWLLCGAALGLGQYFYVTQRALPLVIIVWVALVGSFDPDRLRARLPSLLLGGWLALLLALPLLLYFADQPQEFNAPLQRVTVFDGWLAQEAAARGWPAWRVLLDQVVISARGIVNLPLRHFYEPGTALLRPAQAALFGLGLLLALLQLDRRHVLLLLTLALVIAAGALSRDGPAAQRYVMVAPLAALYVALPLRVTAERLQRALPAARPAIAAGALALVLLLMATDMRFYFGPAQRFVLGGDNTATALALADYLADAPGGRIYFAGWPRMNYDSIASLPFLVPQLTAENWMQPLQAPPAGAIAPPGLFVFLPERAAELAYVQQRFPDGRRDMQHAPDGRLLFIAYWATPDGAE